jgi:hypothetical protein
MPLVSIILSVTRNADGKNPALKLMPLVLGSTLIPIFENVSSPVVDMLSIM